MSRIAITLLTAGLALSACTPKMYTLSEAMAYCQDKADAAAGPQGNISVGVGTGGTTIGAGISISDSFLRGDDPTVVYNTCMNNLEASGQIIGGGV